MKKIATAIATATAIFAGTMTNAHAIGDDGRDALAILGGVYVIEKIVDYRIEKRAPSQQRVYRRPISSEEQRAYEEGVLARERQEAAERRRRAYECGYSGSCY